LDAVRKIGIAAGNQNQVAFQRAVFVDGTGAVDARMKSIARPQFCEHRALGQRFCGGSGHEKLGGVKCVDDFPGVEGIELDAKVSVSKFWPADDFLDALRERNFRLSANWAGFEAEQEQWKHGETAERNACLVFQRVSSSNRSEEHTSELQSRGHLVCRLLLEKKKPV